MIVIGNPNCLRAHYCNPVNGSLTNNFYCGPIFFRDSILFALTNSGTSILGGFVIFMTLGFMSHESSVPIELVAESGMYFSQHLMFLFQCILQVSCWSSFGH